MTSCDFILSQITPDSFDESDEMKVSNFFSAKY